MEERNFDNVKKENGNDFLGISSKFISSKTKKNGETKQYTRLPISKRWNLEFYRGYIFYFYRNGKRKKKKKKRKRKKGNETRKKENNNNCFCFVLFFFFFECSFFSHRPNIKIRKPASQSRLFFFFFFFFSLNRFFYRQKQM